MIDQLIIGAAGVLAGGISGNFATDGVRKAIGLVLPKHNHHLQMAVADAFRKATETLAGQSDPSDDRQLWVLLRDAAPMLFPVKSPVFPDAVLKALLFGDKSQLRQSLISLEGLYTSQTSSETRALIERDLPGAFLHAFGEIIKDDDHKKAFIAFVRETSQSTLHDLNRLSVRMRVLSARQRKNHRELVQRLKEMSNGSVPLLDISSQLQTLAEMMRDEGEKTRRHMNVKTEEVIGEIQRVPERLKDLVHPPPSTPSSVFMTPPHNSSFYERKHANLTSLHERIRTERSAVLHGLPGVGKTQTALAYAHKYRENYPYIFWISAATNAATGEATSPEARKAAETFVDARYNEIAVALKLPEANAQDLKVTTRAVRQWLESTPGWLLIFDNVDWPEALSPPSSAQGRLLFTMRDPAVGLGPPVEVKPMTPEEGANCLLQCAGILQPTEEDRAAAISLSEKMDGLPLALDQAGAYIAEFDCTPADYLDLYEECAADRLKERGQTLTGYTDSVHATFMLAFGQLNKNQPAAAKLLRLCAFLAPDDIPEEIFTEGVSAQADPLADVTSNKDRWNKTVGAALRLALLRRDRSARTLSIHRLAQEVLRAEMTEEKRREQAILAVNALNSVFPLVEFENWPYCERLLPQAQAVALLVERYALETEEAVWLLNETGLYLKERAQYSAAASFLKRALDITEKELGPAHPYAEYNNLAELYRIQGRFEDAEPLYQQSVENFVGALGPQHPEVATSLNNLALLYHDQGRYREAEPLFIQALSIREQTLDSDHPYTARNLDNLGLLYLILGRYREAEPFFIRALSIREKALGPDHPDTAQSCNNLGLLYFAQERYDECERLYVQVVSIYEATLGSNHPDTATSLNNLAGLYDQLNRYDEVESLYMRALAIREKELGPDHPDTANSLNNLANFYDFLERHDEALPILKRAVDIFENALGLSHQETLTSLCNLAIHYYFAGRYGEAIAIIKRVIETYEIHKELIMSETAQVYKLYGVLLLEANQIKEAEQMYARAEEIRILHASLNSHQPPATESGTP